MATVKNRNPPFLKVIFSLSVDIMKANTKMYYEEKRTMKKTQEKKHNKRKIKISKVKKLKPNLLFPPQRSSPLIPLSPLLRCSHAHSRTDSLSPLSPILFCVVRSLRLNLGFEAFQSIRNYRALRVNLTAIKGPKGGEIIMVRTERDSLTYEYK